MTDKINDYRDEYIALRAAVTGVRDDMVDWRTKHPGWADHFIPALTAALSAAPDAPKAPEPVLHNPQPGVCSLRIDAPEPEPNRYAGIRSTVAPASEPVTTDERIELADSLYCSVMDGEMDDRIRKERGDNDAQQ